MPNKASARNTEVIWLPLETVSDRDFISACCSGVGGPPDVTIELLIVFIFPVVRFCMKYPVRKPIKPAIAPRVNIRP